MAVHPFEGADRLGSPARGRLKMIGYFAQVPHAVARDTALAPGVRLLYVIVQGWTQPNGWCYRSLAQLSDDYGSGPRQVQRLLDELVEAHLLLERTAGRGQRKVYAPTVGLTDERRAQVEAAQHDKYVALGANTTELSPFRPANTTVPAPQHDIFVSPNTTFLSPVKEDTPEEPEEEPATSVAAQPDRTAAPAQLELRPPCETVDAPAPPASAPHAGARRPTAAERASMDPRVVEIWDHFRQQIQPRAIVCPQTRIVARLRRFSVEQIRQAIDHFAEDAWWMEHNANQGATWFFRDDSQLERFLHLVPRPASHDARQHPRARPGSSRSDASLDEINASRTGYSGSRTGPLDPELLALVEQRFDRKQ